ncbi:hypothetical protein MKX03_009611 [Papaver bracteatum]|nr:hypothetical protein MKX03_009611 [Papaver bracteatum]
MAKDDLKLSSAKRSYRQASSVGNRQEEARWANVIGDILKNRGEYIEKKHLELANDSGDLIEQQRASTQLGRTYHEMFMKSDDDHSSRRSAKKYFNLAMQLARSLKENGAANESSSFLKEFINAHNNVGMLQMDLDNYKEAERILLEGLRICDEEEVAENDDGRSRLHHHLGYLYTQLRKWEKAKDHIQRDIIICKNIGHRQGEAKGYINLGELYYQDEKFEDTKLCYQKALDIARSMEDEDVLVNQIQENLGIVETAMRVWDDMGKEVQNLKKLSRNTGTTIARGKPDETRVLILVGKLITQKWVCERKMIIIEDGTHFFHILNIFAYIRVCNYIPCSDTCAILRHFTNFSVTKLQLKIQEMKKPQNANHEEEDPLSECAETDTEEYDCPSNECNSPEFSECASTRSKSLNTTEDDVPLNSLLRPRKTLSKQKVAQVERPLTTPTESSPKNMSNSTGKQKMFSGRKRVRLVISDDESDGGDESKYSREKCHIPDENLPTSYDSRKNDGESEFASFHRIVSNDIHSVSTPINHEESNSSYKLGSSKLVVRNDTYFRSFGDKGVVATSGSKADGDHISDNLLQKRNPADFSDDNLLHNITFRIDDKVIHLDAFSCMVDEMLSIESVKSEVACLYYLQLSDEKRSKGLLPVIRNMMCGGKVLESLEPATLKDYIWGKGWIEVTIDVWVQKRLIKLYIDWCKKLSEAPSIKLLKKLYNLEVSEDEILGSECELQDISVAPLLNALNEHKAIALLDFSHNQLGNETIEKLQQIFVSSSQKYGGLTLDLHCNRFGPTALFQICEIVNALCKALYSLNIERCSITSRTIQKVAEAISSGSVLSHLSIAHNNPISGNAMISLLSKLAILKRFSDLNLGGIKLSKSMSDSLCQLMQTSCMSSLIVGNTNIGADGALEVAKALSVGPQELNTLDLSFCGITSCHTERLCTNISLIGGILELNLGGNPIGQQGADALVCLLTSPVCSLKDLVLNKCNLGLAGIIRVLHALTENQVLEELNLEENSDSKKDNTSESDLITQGSLKFLQAEVESSDINPNSCSLKEVEVTHQEKEECIVNSEIELEVADSEEDLPTKGKAVLSGGFDNSCTSSCQKNSSFQGSQLIEELSSSITFAKHLKLLVLSNNGFTTDVAETLYTSWSSSSGRGSARRHIKDQTIHFSVEGKSCCGVKVCCKRD